MIKSFLAALCLATLAPIALAADAPARMRGGVLVDARGMTLYTFDKDVASSGKSACNGPCATLWPPALAGASDPPSGPFGIVTRDDGSRQWSYLGKPVYTYQSDKQPGDRHGDNVKDVWHVIKE
jgi:predicted lipoprotein with Yx(FWY)xxD motif